MADALDAGRRSSDAGRVDRLEIHVGELRDTTRDLKHALDVVKLEQGHMRVLFEAQFRAHSEQASQTSASVQRILGIVEEIKATYAPMPTLSIDVGQVKLWQQQVQGALNFLKYVGWAFVALVLGTAALKVYEVIKAIAGP